jgi:hypothetical protein
MKIAVLACVYTLFMVAASQKEHIFCAIFTLIKWKNVICVKTNLESLVVNVVGHDKMHMLVKFRHIIT